MRKSIHEARRARILDAATQTFTEFGYERAKVEAVALDAGVSTATVYALVGRGELPHTRVGNSIRIDPEVVARWPGSARKGGVR